MKMSIAYNGQLFKFEKPQNGDLLFRWLPKGLPKDTQKRVAPSPKRISDGGQRSGIHSLIEKRQQKIFKEEQHYFSNLQHVGIWYNDNVIEVDEKGIRSNNPLERSHYDIVLRSPRYAGGISNVCGQLKLPIKQQYPINDLFGLSNNPLETRGKVDQIWASLYVEEGEVAESKIQDKHRPQQKVICSHFVHAVLYAATYPQGTVGVATMHEYDDYFKISPERLYRQYRNGEEGTVMNKFGFIYAGLQHKGKLIPYRALYVAGWRSDENILPPWAKLNVVKIFHNELNQRHSIIEDALNHERIVI
jgi:hypothetical protein